MIFNSSTKWWSSRKKIQPPIILRSHLSKISTIEQQKISYVWLYSLVPTFSRQRKSSNTIGNMIVYEKNEKEIERCKCSICLNSMVVIYFESIECCIRFTFDIFCLFLCRKEAKKRKEEANKEVHWFIFFLFVCSW